MFRRYCVVLVALVMLVASFRPALCVSAPAATITASDNRSDAPKPEQGQACKHGCCCKQSPVAAPSDRAPAKPLPSPLPCPHCADWCCAGYVGLVTTITGVPLMERLPNVLAIEALLSHLDPHPLRLEDPPR
jgi:hypothetical protein